MEIIPRKGRAPHPVAHEQNADRLGNWFWPCYVTESTTVLCSSKKFSEIIWAFLVSGGDTEAQNGDHGKSSAKWEKGTFSAGW